MVRLLEMLTHRHVTVRLGRGRLQKGRLSRRSDTIPTKRFIALQPTAHAANTTGPTPANSVEVPDRNDMHTIVNLLTHPTAPVG